MARKVKIGRTRVCSKDYGVTSLTVSGGGVHIHRLKPCEQCPWRMDVSTGIFPTEAYRTSAPTAYDAAFNTFACHMSGSAAPATCAGFLLRHATHNLGYRISQAAHRLDLNSVSDGGFPVYETYREMAIANGVDAADPVLRLVRGDLE